MSARSRLARRRCLDITGIGCPGWLNQQQMHLFLRDGTMLNAFRYNVHLPGPKGDRSIPKLNVEHAFQDEKKSSVSSCLCQTNSPFTFTDHDIAIVELGDCARRPVLGKRRQLL